MKPSDLPPMAEAYLEAALWSSPNNLDPNGGSQLDNDFDLYDLTDEALKRANQDCDDFLEICEEKGISLDDFSDSQLGHDFWLTRNGHGAGFWDGDYPREIGQALTKIAHSFGSCDLYLTVTDEEGNQVAYGYDDDDCLSEDEILEAYHDGRFSIKIHMA